MHQEAEGRGLIRVDVTLPAAGGIMRPAAALDAMHRRETAGRTGLNAGRAAVLAGGGALLLR